MVVLFFILYLKLEVLQQNDRHLQTQPCLCLYIVFFFLLCKYCVFFSKPHSWQIWLPTYQCLCRYLRCSVSHFMILSSTSPWQHIRRRFPLSGVWSVSHTLPVTHTHTHIFADAQKRPGLQAHSMSHLCPRGQAVCEHRRHSCPTQNREPFCRVSKNMCCTVVPVSLHRVTGGELFEDIVAREYYSEADAR